MAEDFTDEERELIEQDKVEQEGTWREGATYVKLDNKNLICTSMDEHQWEYDDPHHKMCRKCGYGVYI